MVEKYLVLVNAHDGSMPLKMFFTPIRVVCSNTLQAALGGFNTKVDRAVSIKHYPGIITKVQEAQTVLGIVNNYYDKFAEASQILVQRSISSSELDQYLIGLIPGETTRSGNKRNRVRQLFETDKNRLSGTSGSVWAAYNAMAEFVDWCRPVSGAKKDPSRRLNSVWFEGGAMVKAQAWDNALELAGVGLN